MIVVEPIVAEDVSSVIAAKIAEIKAEAERRITALDWRLQRAQEREQLNNRSEM